MGLNKENDSLSLQKRNVMYKKMLKAKNSITLQNPVPSQQLVIKKLIAAFLNELLIFLLLSCSENCISNGGIQSLR